jgi:hypothetical protein
MRRHWVLAAEMLTALAQEPQDRRRPNWQATNFAAKVVSHNNNLRLERDNPYTSTSLVDLTKANHGTVNSLPLGTWSDFVELDVRSFRHGR